MGAFPEDYEIKASRLIRMWVAEGFVKVNRDKSLKEEAEDYLKSLVERNLVSVRSYHWRGKPKSYSMHDLLRDLCIRKAFDDKFLCVKDAPEVTFSNMRRVRIHTSYGMKDDDYASSGMSLARSFLLFIKLDSFLSPILSPMFFTLSLLRVLDLLETYIGQFPKGILQLVNLRYLAIDCYSLPSGISRLCNLQTLIARLGGGHAPPDLWEMSELRHLISLGACLVIRDYYLKKPVLMKLQTMWYVTLCASEIGDFLERIPNIEKLLFSADGPELSEVVDFTHLHKLQTLSWRSFNKFLCRFKFPSTLRKLSLMSCVITPVAMTALCALPNLEVFNIYYCTFKSNETNEEEEEEWEIAEGDEFSSLQFLQLYCLQLVHWRADETNFPRLRHLLIEDCKKLEEIPAGIGEIPTLQLIHLEACSDSAVASAKQIQEEQQSEYGNYDLQLRIVSYDD
ncbi:putative late blight resistance protein homolog R1A-3 [Salvia miltiorrhiza]|uniref:putative late blight resistance protein homolog R1A-3 n=1 Tax=Salvia miltiorrhiza TaxID=226208 RepID=UPI0025AB74D2|nr:putative late blight resistance protein homolog R1A-3 [Salvia miltiorrhiza]